MNHQGMLFQRPGAVISFYEDSLLFEFHIYGVRHSLCMVIPLMLLSSVRSNHHHARSAGTATVSLPSRDT